MKPSVISNCEDDEDFNLLTTEPKQESSRQENYIEEEGTGSDTSLYCPSTTSSSSSNNSSGSSNSNVTKKKIHQKIALITTLLATQQKCLDKFKCINYEKTLIVEDNLNDKKQLLIINIIHKTYKTTNLPVGLRKPSDVLNKLVKKSLRILKYFLELTPEKSNLSKICCKKYLKKLIYLKTLYIEKNVKDMYTIS